jgi:hypothetical protein
MRQVGRRLDLHHAVARRSFSGSAKIWRIVGLPNPYAEAMARSR